MKKNKIACVIAYRKGHTNYGTSLVGYALIKKLQMLVLLREGEVDGECMALRYGKGHSGTIQGG